MFKSILFLSTLLFLLGQMGCSKTSISTLLIQADSPVQVNGLPLSTNAEGFYIYPSSQAHPTLVTLEHQGSEWEVYFEPGTTAKATIQGDSISFSGDFQAENQHLVLEKSVNEELGAFLKENLYSMTTKGEANFVQVVDSLKGVFIQLMEANPQLKRKFVDLNRAALNYSFNRLMLRYPDFYQSFTGKATSLSSEIKANMQLDIDHPEHLELVAYQKYVRTWMKQAIAERTQNVDDSKTYKGLLVTQAKLGLINETFKSRELNEFWTFETIKAHIEQHTWINGEDLLAKFEARCKTPRIKEAIAHFKQDLLETRAGLDYFVYKTVKEFKLEAFRVLPANFDPTKRYPALAAFHGGGWISGNAQYTNFTAKHGAQSGFVSFAVEYRLSNRDDVSPLEAMDDTRDFIRWVREYADSLSINPDQVVAKGISAGGHLVSAISVLQTDPKSVPNAIVLVSPAIDVQDGYFKSLLHPGQDPLELSAVDNLTADLNMPRTLFLQGRTDNLTPTRFTQAFHDKLIELGHESELVIYEGCGHLFTPSHLDDTGYPQSDPEISRQAFERQVEFFKDLNYSN